MKNQNLEMTYPELMVVAEQATNRKQASKVLRKAKEMREITWEELWGQK